MNVKTIQDIASEYAEQEINLPRENFDYEFDWKLKQGSYRHTYIKGFIKGVEWKNNNILQIFDKNTIKIDDKFILLIMCKDNQINSYAIVEYDELINKYYTPYKNMYIFYYVYIKDLIPKI